MELKSSGPSRETFSALSERLQKPSGQVDSPAAFILLIFVQLHTHQDSVFQIAHRFHQLMKLFKKREKMEAWAQQEILWLHHYSSGSVQNQPQTCSFFSNWEALDRKVSFDILLLASEVFLIIRSDVYMSAQWTDSVLILKKTAIFLYIILNKKCFYLFKMVFFGFSAHLDIFRIFYTKLTHLERRNKNQIQ